MKKQAFILAILLVGFNWCLEAQTGQTVKLNIQVEEVPGTQNEVIGALVVERFENMGAYQFSLQWETDELEYIDLQYINTELSITHSDFNFNHTHEGFLPTLWSSASCKGLNPGDTLMAFSFKRFVPMSEFIISPDPIGLRFYDCDGEMLDLDFTDNQGTQTRYGDNTTHTLTPPTSEHFSVSPNPTTGQIRIESLSQNSSSQYQYTLLSLLGNRLAEGKLNGNSIDLPTHLPSGQYLLRIGREGVSIGTKSIVLVK
nr:T9SS type A sorting domain-containing protein [Saprospiraceae bacterium]